MPKNATFRDMQQLLPVLDGTLASKDELVAIKNLTFRQAVSIDSTDCPGVCDTTEMRVDTFNQIKARHVTKVIEPRIVHCRTTGVHCSLKSNSKDRSFDNYSGELNEELPVFHSLYTVDDVISLIRPSIDPSNNSASNNVNSYQRSRTQSSFSMGNVEKESSVLSTSDFPFILPSSLLEEADEDVWNPVPLCETLPDYEPILNKTLFQEDIKLVSDEIVCSPLSRDEDSDSANMANDVTDVHLEEIHEDAVSDACSNQVIDRIIPSQSMFEGIWEQTYRENVASGAAAINADHSTMETSPRAITDYDSEELNAVYDGPPDYSSIFISSDLDLYYDSYVFPRSSQDDDSQADAFRKDATPPRIQLFKFDRNSVHERTNHCEDLSEHYIGVWKEDVIACGSFARSRLQQTNSQKRGFHGEIVTMAGKDAFVSESRKIIVCLSDSALYLIVDDDITAKPRKTNNVKRPFPSKIPTDATFANAHWPHALVRHPLVCLVGITIGFQFQRLLLRFSVSNTNGITLEYTYIILTSSKLQTISLLQKLQSVSEAQSHVAMSIENDDKAFLDALGTKTDEVVLHYQIVR
jgi:hypothetical protein